MQHAKSENKEVVSAEPHLLFISLDLMEVLKVVIYLKYWWQAQFYNKRFTFKFICRHSWQQAVHTKIKCINMWHHSFKNIHFHYIFLFFTTHTKIIQKSQQQIRRVYCVLFVPRATSLCACTILWCLCTCMHIIKWCTHVIYSFCPTNTDSVGADFSLNMKEKKNIYPASELSPKIGKQKNVIWFENKCMDENIAISTFYKHFKMRKNTETALITLFSVFCQTASLQFISSNVGCTSCCKQLICRQSGRFLSNMTCVLSWCGSACKVASVSGLLFTAENFFSSFYYISSRGRESRLC